MAPTIRAVEPAACPSLTQGVYAYDFGDTAGMTPLMKMHTLGHDFIPDPIHAGGLRYHGMCPLISHLYELGLIEAVAKTQTECFAAGVRFARTEGIVPAPEPTHALAAAIEEALRCKETGEEKVILTALCGHGHLDLPAYDAYLSGSIVDHDWNDADAPRRRCRQRSRSFLPSSAEPVRGQAAAGAPESASAAEEPEARPRAAERSAMMAMAIGSRPVVAATAPPRTMASPWELHHRVGQPEHPAPHAAVDHALISLWIALM